MVVDDRVRLVPMSYRDFAELRGTALHLQATKRTAAAAALGRLLEAYETRREYVVAHPDAIVLVGPELLSGVAAR